MLSEVVTNTTIVQRFDTFSKFYKIGLPPRYNWNIVESGVKHHKPTIYHLQVILHWQVVVQLWKENLNWVSTIPPISTITSHALCSLNIKKKYHDGSNECRDYHYTTSTGDLAVC